MDAEQLLEPAELRRYADAIVKASLGVAKGDTLVVQAEPAHRELAVAVVDVGYRAGATIVELQYYDPLVTRARLLHGRDEALGVVSPWSKRRLQELAKPHGRARRDHRRERARLPRRRPAEAHRRRHHARPRAADRVLPPREPRPARALDGRRAGRPTTGPARSTRTSRRSRRSGASPRTSSGSAGSTDEDGKGSSGWLKHVRALARRGAKLTKLGLERARAARPGHVARPQALAGHALARRAGGDAGRREDRAEHADGGDVHEPPRARRPKGTFACTFPLSFQGRLIDGLRGEFRGGRLVRLDARSRKDRDFVAAVHRQRPERQRPPPRRGRARSTRRRGSARAAGRTSTRCSTRTPPRTSRSAPASAARASIGRRAE